MGLDFKYQANSNHRRSTQMKTKPLKLSAAGVPDNGRAQVIYKQYELFGPGSRALAPNNFDQRAKLEAIALTINESSKADLQLLRDKTKTSE